MGKVGLGIVFDLWLAEGLKKLGGVVVWMLLLSLSLAPHRARATEWEVRGEVMSYATAVEGAGPVGVFRYLPTLKAEGSGVADWQWDSEATGFWYQAKDPSLGAEQKGEMLRAWVRVYDPQIEVRLGLQELSFGPAVLLRSLQWFDTKDPLDPTGFTKGVKGALVRISTDSNAQYWVWGLVDNQDLSAQTRYVSDTQTPEYGGRAQFSKSLGEWAVTMHQRQVQLSAEQKTMESRVAFDTKLDLPYNGLWLEMVQINRQAEQAQQTITKEGRLTLGADYSLNLYDESAVVTVEKNWNHAALAGGTLSQVEDDSALLVSLPMGLLDVYSLSWFEEAHLGLSTASVDWQRTYDRYFWDLSLFQVNQRGAAPLAGVGILFQYNH